MSELHVDYVRAGLALVPIPKGRKGPVTTGWQQRANVITDTERAAALNGGNLGLAHAYCSPTPTCAIDVDDWETAEAWLSEHGIDLAALVMAPDAVQVRSGRPNRTKLLYRLPRPLPTVKVAGDKLELRCASRDGLTVQDVLPPSTHPEGRAYEWLGDWRAIPQIPAPLLALWERQTQAPEPTQAIVETAGSTIPEGRRENILASLAGSMRYKGMDAEAIAAALAVVNRTRCNPPLPEQAIQRIARSIARYEPGVALDPEPLWPEPLDLEALAEHDPEPPAFIVPDWLPCGYATLLAGHGGVGKSGIALYLAVCVAAGLSFFGLEVQRRRVLYLSCEDREGVLHWRLRRICAHLGIDLARLRGWLEILDLVGTDTILWDRDPRTGQTATPALGALTERMEKHHTQVLMVDGVSDTFAGNENARVDVKRFVNALLALIPREDGALALIGHIAKPAATGITTSEGYSGSTAWHNAVRARWYLYPETKPGEDGDGRPAKTGDLILELQKSNLGATDQSMRFSWDTAAHLFVGREIIGATAADRAHRDRLERAAVLAALQGCREPVPAATNGPRTAFTVLSRRPEFPNSIGSDGASRRRFWRHIEDLRQMGQIREGSYRRTNRHWTLTLVPSSEGSANAPNAE